MKIAIDAHMIGHKSTGNETYMVNLINALGRLHGNSHQYTVYVDQAEAHNALHSCNGHMSFRQLATHSPLIRVLFLLPMEFRRAKADVVHMQYILSPVLPRCASVVTIHDISFEHFPGVFKPTELLRDKLLVPFSARRADAVLTVSEFTKADLVKTYGIAPEKIVVAVGSVDSGFRLLEDRAKIDGVCRQYGIDGPFILYVGNIQPRKNLVRLVQAYAALVRGESVPHRLVIVGNKAWRHLPVLEAVRAFGLEQRVVFTGYIPEEDVCALYNAADLFVFPSIFEGFGLPIVEAMACGTPVITSNTSSMPEAGGEAAIYVDPFSVPELTLAMRKVLEDADLRARLSASGLARAAQFSWEEAARKAVRAYEMAADSRFRPSRCIVKRAA